MTTSATGEFILSEKAYDKCSYGIKIAKAGYSTLNIESVDDTYPTGCPQIFENTIFIISNI